MATEFDLKVRKDSATPNFDKWKAGLKSKNPDIDETDMEALYGASMRGYDAEHDYAKSERDYVTKLREVIETNPRVGEFLDDIVNKGLGSALASLSDLQQALMKGEITDDEYTRAVEDAKKAEAEAAQKMAEQTKAFENVCEKLGLDAEEVLKKLSDLFFIKIANSDLREKDWEVLINMLNYDDNLRQAEIKGRNEQIDLKRGEIERKSDGLYKKGSAPSEETYKDVKDFSMIDSALTYQKQRRFK